MNWRQRSSGSDPVGEYATDRVATAGLDTNVRRTLDEIGKDYHERRIVVLGYLTGMSIQQIAAATDAPVDDVRHGMRIALGQVLGVTRPGRGRRSGSEAAAPDWEVERIRRRAAALAVPVVTCPEHGETDMSGQPQCLVCVCEVPQQENENGYSLGRPRLYCSNACRQRAYRRRRSGVEEARGREATFRKRQCDPRRVIMRGPEWTWSRFSAGDDNPSRWTPLQPLKSGTQGILSAHFATPTYRIQTVKAYCEWAEIRGDPLVSAASCMECAMFQHETDGRFYPRRRPRHRRTVPGRRESTLYLCNDHKEAWRDRDVVDRCHAEAIKIAAIYDHVARTDRRAPTHSVGHAEASA